jgi:AraC-like DNA-binding protein
MLDHIRFHKVPFAGVDAMSATSARTFPRHTHDQYGMGIVDSGRHASLSDRGHVEAGPGSLIFVNPGEVHDGRAIGGRPRSWRILYFDPTAIEETRADISDGANSPFAFAEPVFADDTLRGLFDAAFAQVTATAGSRDAMECQTAIIRLVARAQVNSTAKPRRPQATSCIRRAIALIDADPSSAELTLVRLAREVHLSRYQLLRSFSRELGLTPHAYILQQRLATARRLIRAGNGLAETAACAGFFDQSHLTHRFAGQFGVTPSRYASRRL